MDGYLRQSTASQTRWIGPYVDSTDFITAKTGLTIANTDIKVSKNGGSSASKNSGGGTHDVNGNYAVTWDATDTATVGQLAYTSKVAGALQVWGTFTVLEEAVYDALFVGSAPGYVVDQPVNATKVGGTSQTGRDLGASVLLSAGTGTGQVNLTSGAVPVVGDLTATMKTSVTTAATASTPALSVAGVNAVADQVWDEVLSGHVTALSTGAALNGAASAGDPWLTSLPGAYGAGTAGKIIGDKIAASVTGAVGSVTGAVGSVTGNVGGNVTGSIGSVAAAGITNASLAADTGLKTIRSNTATAGAATTITLDASASAVDNVYRNDLLYLTGGTGAGQARFISGYVGATKVATVSTWATNPDNTSTFAILPSDGTTAPTAAAIADQVWDELIAGHAVSGSTGEALSAAGAAGDPWITALPGSYSAGQAGKIIGDNINGTITSRMATFAVPTNFSSLSISAGGLVDVLQTAADKVWSTAARLLTAGTNIVLAKGTGVTGFTDLSAAQVTTAASASTPVATLSGDLTATMKTSVTTAASAATPVATVSGDLSATMKTSVTTAATAATPALSAAGVDAILDDTIGDSTITMRQALRVLLAGMAGKLSGAATATIVIRNVADSKDRITATVDSNGNRSAITLDVS